MVGAEEYVTFLCLLENTTSSFW